MWLLQKSRFLDFEGASGVEWAGFGPSHDGGMTPMLPEMPEGDEPQALESGIPVLGELRSWGQPAPMHKGSKKAQESPKAHVNSGS